MAKPGEQQVPWGACPACRFFGVYSCWPCCLPLYPWLLQGHVGCPRGWLPGARVRTSCVSAGVGCQRGHNPGVLQTPGVSSSAATDTGAWRHTRAFWVDAVSKQMKVELQPTDTHPPRPLLLVLGLTPPQAVRRSLPKRTQTKAKLPGRAGWELRLELGSKGPAFCISVSAPHGPEGASEPIPQRGE